LHPKDLQPENPGGAAIRRGESHLHQEDIHKLEGEEGDRETNQISADGNPTLCTSVVVPGGLPRAIPVSALPKSIQKDETKQIKYNI
jgi:hypothetical protein